MIQVIYARKSQPPTWSSCVATMGDFDGFHRGHKELITKTQNRSKALGVPSVLLTFYPSPKQVVGTLQEHDSIFTKEEKIRIAEHLQIDVIIFLPFSQEMLKLEAKDFIVEWLVNYVKAEYILIGFDHRFGFKRQGDYTLLEKMSRQYSYQVEKISPVTFAAAKISSSRIRRLIREGAIEEVNQLLGYAFLFIGQVVHGKARGKGLGFPTANLQILKEKIVPAKGVYFCMAYVQKRLYRCLVNIGHNPTFGNGQLSLEAYIMGLQQEIYGMEVQLFFIQRLRDEKKFSSAAELQAQIQADVTASTNMVVDEEMLFY